MKIRRGLRSRGQADMWRAPACHPSRQAASSAGVHLGFPQRARAAIVPNKRRSRLFHRFMRVFALAAPPRRPISCIRSMPLGVRFAMLHRYPIIFYVSKRASNDAEAIGRSGLASLKRAWNSRGVRSARSTRQNYSVSASGGMPKSMPTPCIAALFRLARRAGKVTENAHS
jgi:hypothetical protein